MQAYSNDLRERVVAAYATGQFPIAQVASRFVVSVSFVDKLLKRQRTSGLVAALPRRGGPAPRPTEADRPPPRARPGAPPPRLTEPARQRLWACLVAQPDATLDELRQPLLAAGGPAVGRTLLWQTRQQVDGRRNKRAYTPPSATPNAGADCASTFLKRFSTKTFLALSSWTRRG